MKYNKFVLLLAVISFASTSFAKDEVKPTENKYESTFKKFEKQDAENPPKTGGVLFLGSSSIRMWDLEKWFDCPSHTMINRGFGGSMTSDVLYFFDRIIPVYKPKTIVFYCGDNDIARKKSPEEVLKDFDTFWARTKKELPQCHLLYVPVKQSFAREKMWDEMMKVNEGIQKRAARITTLHYCDTIPLLLNEEGQLDRKYFLKDGLHLSDAGYEKWTKLVKSYLSELE